METLQDWFVKQGIGNLWTDEVAESEEVLVLLASEKQWDDINEICQSDLKIPKIKSAYLKAYLIKRTKELINDNENDNGQPSQQQIEMKQHKSSKNNKIANKKNKNNNDHKSSQNKSNKKSKNNKSKQKSTKNDARSQQIKRVESEPTANEKQQTDKIDSIQILESDITQQPEYKTNYGQNGFKYKDIAIVDVSLNNNDFVKYFDEKQPCIVRGTHLLAQIPTTWNAQYLANKLSNNLCKVQISKCRHFREQQPPQQLRQEEIMEMPMHEFINNYLRHYYYLETTSSLLHKYYACDILKQCQASGLISNYLCISSAGCVIPLKYKERDNIIVSINGCTEIILFSPIATPYLYPFPYGHRCYRQSMVNCEYPSGLFKHFNISNQVLCDNMYRCVLSKGDILYIPSYWWREMTHLKDFSVNIVFENERQLNKSKTKIDINQIFDDKTIEQKIAIGRNIERVLFNKYGANENITTEIFKSFLNSDEKYSKYRSEVRKLLKNVFHENEIDEFVGQLVDGRYNQFRKHNNDITLL